ncbi:MAG: hypothetical protein OSB69_12420, partial [Alphaproteobacteria bacterium]|nr:hypothetical protein [Alphaproteobacteria bacterium]
MKGIDASTRAIARARARGSEITIGAWIDQAILKYAGQRQPAGTVEINSADNQTDEHQQRADLPTQKTLISLSDPQEFLDLVDQELEASRSRLDKSLRPVGFVLEDLALRLVAAAAAKGPPPQVEPFTPIINEADMATPPYPRPTPPGERLKRDLMTVALTRNHQSDDSGPF